MTRKNMRPLAEITADIHKVERQNVFTLGNLLREAREQVPYGKWLPYLKSIDWVPRTAQVYMSVAEMTDKYANIAHLNAASSALYQLTSIEENYPDVMPLAIERLKKSIERGDNAAQQRLTVALSRDAKAAEDAGFKNTTELALKAASDALNQNCLGIPERFAAMEAQSNAIINANPKTEEELKAVIAQYPIPVRKLDEIEDDGISDEIEDEEIGDELIGEMLEEMKEIEDKTGTLVGVLNRRLDIACGLLTTLCAKSSSTFIASEMSADDLDMLGNFLKQIAASKRTTLEKENRELATAK